MFITADQERDLARRYRVGDKNAGDQLTCAYMPLVKRVAGKFGRKFSSKLLGFREDLVSVGWVGLMKAVRSYDPDRGARLGTYAIKWIVAELREFTMNQVPMKSLNVAAIEAHAEQRHLDMHKGEDQEEALAEADEWRMRRAFLKRALESLSDPERLIIVERHLREQATPLKDLGARFGLSGESIRQMELKALKALKGMAAA